MWNVGQRKKIPYDVTHMWNLRHKTNKQMEKKNRERGTPRNRLLTVENKLMVTREKVGRGVG